MSRTFRRKGYEQTKGSSWAREGNSVAGYYTQYEYDWVIENGDYVRYAIWRKPTKREYDSKYWDLHSDNHQGRWSVKRWWRNSEQRKERRFNEKELFRWDFREDYEPMFKNNEDNSLWYWWD